MNMPIVSMEIIQSTTASIEKDDKFWQSSMSTMLEENPLLYQLLVVSQSTDMKTDEFNEGYIRGATLIYILLSHQVEAEDMNSKWG